MATELFMTKRLGSLVPADDQGKEELDAIPQGTIVRAKITTTQKRSLEHHRLFFGLIKLVAPNTDYTPDELLAFIKIGIGHVDWVPMPLETVNGGLVEVPMPRSIKFGKMDQVEFRKFFNRSVDFIITRIIPGTNKADLERELFELLGIPSWSAA